MAFLNIENTFDNINWKILFNIMVNVDIDNRYKYFICNIQNQEAEIKINTQQNKYKEKRKTRMSTVTFFIQCLR